MKKILSLCALLVLLSVAASAQTRSGNIRRARIARVQVTRPERLELRKDAFRYESLQRRSRRDGMVTPLERKRLHKAKRETRTDRFRFRHNRRRRLI
jgi:hypothetical protein